MGNYISRECALGPDWTGNGIDGMLSAFHHVSEVDFTEVSVDYSGMSPGRTTFTVSSCGKFLMAVNGCLIYVYQLNRSHRDDDTSSHPGLLRPITSVICPRRVLSCSIDTSSERYAIAALIDGRMGVLCDFTAHIVKFKNYEYAATDLKPLCSTKKTVDQIYESEGGFTGSAYLDRVSLNSSSSCRTASGTAVAAPFVFPGIIASPAASPNVFSKFQGPTVSEEEVSFKEKYSSQPNVVSAQIKELYGRTCNNDRSSTQDVGDFGANKMPGK